MVTITLSHIDQLSVYFLPQENHINVKVNVLASSVVDRGFEPQSGQAKDWNLYVLLLR